MSKHGNKRGRPSLGASSPPPKRPAVASSLSISRPDAATSLSLSGSPSTASLHPRRPSALSSREKAPELPGPATQTASLSFYDRASIVVPDTLKSIWSYFQSNPVPAPATSPRSSRKKRRIRDRSPEMRATNDAVSLPGSPSSSFSSPSSTARSAASAAPGPLDWRTNLAVSYAASIPLPPSPPRTRDWLPPTSSSSSSSPHPPSVSSPALQRSQSILHTPNRSSTGRISKPTPGSTMQHKASGSPALSQQLRTSAGKAGERKSAKERLRDLRVRMFMLEQAQQRFKEKREQVERQTGHGVREDAGVDKASFSDYALKLARIDTERELNEGGKSSLMTEIQKSGKQARDVPEDWVARLSLTEQKASSTRRPPPLHLPSYDQLLTEDEIRDKKIAERIASLKVEKYPEDLTSDQKQEVKALLARSRQRKEKYKSAEVDYENLSRLRPGAWLNDEVILFYCLMVVDACEARLRLADAWGKEEGLDPLKARRKWVGPKGELALDVHLFNTHFFSRLEDPRWGYQQGKLNRWTKKVDIFKKDIVLIPINQNGTHWSCAVINFRHKRIEAYDSMGRPGGARYIFRLLRHYLQLESQDKKQKDFDFEGWEDWEDNSTTPQQLNGYDCGVFTCHFLEALSRGGGFGRWTFGQENMPYFRQRMLLEMSRGRLLNHPDSEEP